MIEQTKDYFLFLGTAASAGIPMIGCKCSVCTSTNPNNNRTRPSALLHLNGKNFLIDTGPDLRFQALRFGLSSLDGVLITHTHYDHIGGLDELRIFYLMNKKKIPILLSRSSFLEIEKRLPYLFKEKKKEVSLTAQLDFHILEQERGDIDFLGTPIKYMTYEQGGMAVTGFRFGNLAYTTDVKNFPETIFEDLKGIDTLILSALSTRSSKMHLSIEQAIEFVKKVQPKQTYLMHIAHEIDHEIVSKTLPQGISLAHDGLSFAI